MNKQLYNLEKNKVDNPARAKEIDSEINFIKEEIKNVQIAIEENDKTKEKISESLLKNENNKKALKHILIKLISKSDTKNGSYEEAFYKSTRKDKDFKEGKLGEVLSEVDQLKKLLEEKERQIKEISQLQNNQNRINDYADRDNIIGIFLI